MHLRQRFRLLLGIQFALAIGLAILTGGLFQNQRALRRAQQTHFQSYLLADELRQSSDDLTRLARTFVATGEAEYERQYLAVLAIRNGKAPRPADYHRIYWDLVTKDTPKPRPDGPAISLHDLMIREGFTAAELALLTSAQKYSDALVQSERLAMSVAQGLFADGAGNFTVRGTPDRARAITLLHDEAYRDNKARIMRPIDDFYVMFAERTAGEIAKFDRRSLALLSVSSATIVVLLGLFIYSFASLRREMLNREHAEAALRENEARIRILGDNLPGGMIYQLEMTPDGKERRFVYLSAGVERLHEVTAATVMEDAGVLYRRIVPEDRAAMAAKETAALAAMKSFTAEMRSQLPSGRIRWHLVTTAPRRAAGGQVIWDGFDLDITERKEADEALRFSEERHRLLAADLEQRVAHRTAELAARHHETQALLDSIPDTVWLFDHHGAVISAHSPADRADPTDSADQLILNSDDEMLLGIAREIHALARSTRQSVVQDFDRTLQGATISFEARATPAGQDRFLVLLRDISVRKRIEREIVANLERQKQLSEMKSQFMTVASHEFRTPLATAVGSVELLERHAGRLTEAKRSELLTRIQQALSRLTSIMDDMLMLTRADSGRMKVARMDVDLGRFVTDVLRSVETNDRQQHTFSFQQIGPPGVPADTNLLHHILSNLLENAVRYSPAGTKVAVVLEVSDQAFALTITDEGMGVPEADRERIFEPFVRGSNIGAIGGTGLGLNLARRYAELMGGRIELLPTVRGAAFRVSIPLHQPPA